MSYWGNKKFTDEKWTAHPRSDGYTIQPNIAWVGSHSGRTAEETKANANAIAAVPAMYEALEAHEDYANHLAECQTCEKDGEKYCAEALTLGVAAHTKTTEALNAARGEKKGE